jgi:hypothetical protein
MNYQNGVLLDLKEEEKLEQEFKEFEENIFYTYSDCHNIVNVEKKISRMREKRKELENTKANIGFELNFKFNNKIMNSKKIVKRKSILYKETIKQKSNMNLCKVKNQISMFSPEKRNTNYDPILIRESSDVIIDLNFNDIKDNEEGSFGETNFKLFDLSYDGDENFNENNLTKQQINDYLNNSIC